MIGRRGFSSQQQQRKSGTTVGSSAAQLQSRYMDDIRTKLPSYTNNRRRPRHQARNSSTDTTTTTTTTAATVVVAHELSEKEWAATRALCVSRGHCALPCAICHEHFKTHRTLLLSCGHVFHASCVHSFERFAYGGARTCPLCRHTGYTTRVIDDGAVPYRIRCATRIQSWWRAYVARKRVRRIAPPRWMKSKRRQFLLNRLQATTGHLLDAMDEKDASIDALFAELDRSVRHARTIFDEGSGGDGGGDGDGDKEEVWRRAEAAACERQVADCPICMNALSTKTQVLLSCSHMFHDDCLCSFEHYALGGSGGGGGGCHAITCPLCRSSYSKRIVIAHPS